MHRLFPLSRFRRALGSSDAVFPQATRVKPCHFPPEFWPNPGLEVPLRTNAPERERGTVGDLSVVTKHLEKNDFGAKRLWSKPTCISIFSDFPTPSDPRALTALYRLLHFSAVLPNSYCLSCSWKPVSESKFWFSAFVFHCLSWPKLSFRENEGKHHHVKSLEGNAKSIFGSTVAILTPAMFLAFLFFQIRLRGNMVHYTYNNDNEGHKHTATIQLNPLPYRWNTSIRDFQSFTKTSVLMSKLLIFVCTK